MKDYSPLVPFDLYDFFGYLFPGILFATSTAMFLFQVEPSFLCSSIQNHSSAIYSLPDVPFVWGLAIVVACTVLLYALGHFIAILSYIIIDRVLVDGIEGYPINFQLDIPQQKRDYSEATFKYLFVLFNLFLLVPVLISDSTLLHVTLTAVLVLFAVLIAQRFVIMIIRTTPAGRQTTRRLGDLKVFRLLLVPSAKMIDPALGFFHRLLGLDRRLPDSLVALYKKLFRKRFPSLVPDEVGSENYWLSAFHATADCEIHERALHTWLHLYSFARNASGAFCLSASMIIGYLYFNPIACTPTMRIQLLTLWFLAGALGLRYWVLYSKYYTKGVVRAFVESLTRKG